MRSESSRVFTIFDMPEAVAKHLLEVLKNDLKEYESLDEDFGKGAEISIKSVVEELEKHFT